MDSGILILLRHGLSKGNKEGYFTGHMDVDLEPEGEIEAEAAGLILKERGYIPHEVFTSPLVRASRTAAIVVTTLGLPIETVLYDRRLIERDFGDWQGMSKAGLKAQYGDAYVHRLRSSFFIGPPNGESIGDVSRRVEPLLRHTILPSVEQGKTILIVSHSNMTRALLILLGEIAQGDETPLDLPNAAPIILKFGPISQIVERQFLSFIRPA